MSVGYHGQMANSQARAGRFRRTLVWVIVVACLVLLAAVSAVVVPIVTHQSAGGSGQQVPQGFVSEAKATGADGRTREVRVETVDGAPADLSAVRAGDELVVRGTGFDSAIGIYVSICQVPSQPGQKPAPCLGGMPEGADQGAAAGQTKAQTSVWISDDWAWRAFASHGYADAQAGSFEARLLVANPVQEGLDCRVARCAITTRADHTAASDRVQDMQLPVQFTG